MGYHVRVKICGITNPTDLDQAIAAGADAIGLNFHPPSPRSIPTQTARELLERLPPLVDVVGVFAGKQLAEAAEQVAWLGRVNTVQLHGVLPDVCDPYPYRLVPAFQVRNEADLALVTEYLDRCRRAQRLPSAILVDGHAPGLVGGTGQRAPWDLLAEYRPGVPLILAGGLTPDNVAEAVRRVRPFAVDVASGVESSPGCKDAGMVRRFVEAAREAGA